MRAPVAMCLKPWARCAKAKPMRMREGGGAPSPNATSHPSHYGGGDLAGFGAVARYGPVMAKGCVKGVTKPSQKPS
jgi:hypothetical protein